MPEAMLNSDATLPVIGTLAALPAANLGTDHFAMITA